MLYNMIIIKSQLVLYLILPNNESIWFSVVGIERHFQQYFSNIVAVSFIDRWNRRKPPTWCKSLIKLYHTMFYQVHLDKSGIRILQLYLW